MRYSKPILTGLAVMAWAMIIVAQVLTPPRKDTPWN